MGRRKSTSEKILTLLFWIVLVAIIGWFVKEDRTRIDVSHLIEASRETIEAELEVELSANPQMVKKIYEYSEGEISVEGGSDPGVTLIYIDKIRKGFHIDKKRYTMFGVQIGDSVVDVDRNLSYVHEGTFEVLDDYLDQGISKGVFYYNEAKNDCLIIVYNDATGLVVALTYYSDYKKATEELSGI